MIRTFLTLAIGLILTMTATADIRPHLAFAAGLDLTQEADVRRGVDAYVEMHGDTFDRFHFEKETAVQAILFFPRYCRLTKAEFAGRPFVLTDWQAFDIVAVSYTHLRAHETDS